MTYSGKEIESQRNRIQKIKDDKEKDEHDVRKQEEVLAEYLGGRKYELDKLVEYADQLEAYLVRSRSNPRAALVCTCCSPLFGPTTGRVCPGCRHADAAGPDGGAQGRQKSADRREGHRHGWRWSLEFSARV